MKENIWKTLYDRARFVQNERKLSPLMEVGSVGAAILTDSGINATRRIVAVNIPQNVVVPITLRLSTPPKVQ